MNWPVYMLFSEKDSGLYVGCSENLPARLQEHDTGRALSTSNRRPLVLIHREVYEQKGKAFSRERFLKSLWGARLKRKILKDYLLARDHSVQAEWFRKG